MASQAVVELPKQEGFSHQNKYVVGEVELYYNQWIVTDGQSEAPRLFQTPGKWNDRLTQDGVDLPSDGYASYRYVIKGLKPGSLVLAFDNVEIPNRIFLNRTLSSSKGSPSRERQSTFVNLSEGITESVVVPEDGIVEYVIEIGNTGQGGLNHIGAIYLQGNAPRLFTSAYISTLALGFMFATFVTLLVLNFISPKRWPMVLLSVLLLAVVFVYLFSLDSVFIGAGWLFSEPVFEWMRFILLCVAVLLSLVFRWMTDSYSLEVFELAGLLSGLGVTIIIYIVTHGTGLEWIPMLLLFTFPVYVLIRSFIRGYHGNFRKSPLLLYTCLGAYVLVSAFFNANVFFTPFIYHPTFFSLAFTAGTFICGFSEIHRVSLVKKDAAVLERRYRGISNRALARLSSESETITVLRLVGTSYEQSLKAGDRRLLGFSSLMRKRLVALRKDKIPFSEECELESQLVSLRNDTFGREATLLLGVEKGTFEVPPLIFESLIDSLCAQVGEEEYISLEEVRRGVVLRYPTRLFPEAAILQSMEERCQYLSLELRVRKGEVRLLAVKRK
ncbi:MAG: hypothetical protein K6E59_04595 [Bacilli bacterium]|nr:hypothetical protein [Bacilli bacterium]